MAQVFPEWTNRIPLFGAAALPAVGLLVVAGIWYYFSPNYTDVGYMPVQPVPYSHALHVGELGLDCRYCHSSVENSPVAVIPPTRTCMNCHSIIKRDSELLAPLRASTANGTPLRWVRVHNLPDYAYFNHSVHVTSGIGCKSCHGSIHEMEVVWQAESLSMSWCLDCHRAPEQHLRPVEEVTNMEWAPGSDHGEWAAGVSANLAPPTDCSGCHR